MKHFGSAKYALPLTRLELAEVVGFSKESVNLSLAWLAKDGLIVLSGKQVEIVDEERLRIIALNG
jgi:DNA-binding GntR family transcriptional regulator